MRTIITMVTIPERKDGHNNHDDGRSKGNSNTDQCDHDNGGNTNDGSDKNDCKNCSL